MKENITAILEYLLYTGIFSTTLPLVFYLLFKRNGKQKSLRVVLFYILYCIFNEGMSYYLQKNRSENFVFLLYAFTIFEYSFFCLFIYLVLPKSLIKKFVPFIWIGFILFAIIDILYISRINDFDSFTIGIEYIIIFILCISYLIIQLKRSNSSTIYSSFNFWVVITFLIYFCGTFFLYLMTNSISHTASFRKQYLIINISFNILKNILLCVALTMKLNDSVKQQKNGIPDLDDDIFISEKTNFRS